MIRSRTICQNLSRKSEAISHRSNFSQYLAENRQGIVQIRLGMGE